MEETKFCKKCNTHKKRSEYSKRTAAKDGLQAFCKKCSNHICYWHYRETRSAYSVKWREANKDYHREYRKANPERITELSINATRRRRARKRAARGSFTQEEFLNLTKTYDNKCYYCKNPLKIKGKKLDVHADHFIPLSKSGDNTIHNIVPACPRCNTQKGKKLPWEFSKNESFSPKPPELWRLDNLNKL